MSRLAAKSTDSPSLWNYSLSPGWTEQESELLRRLLIRHGIGNWAQIRASGCLSRKTNAQMNLQLQRMLGQQSTMEFHGLHIDPKRIGEINAQKHGEEIKRKNNIIVNTGGKLTSLEIKARMEHNRQEFEEPVEVWMNVEVALLPTDIIDLLARKRQRLEALMKELVSVDSNITKLTASQVAPEEMREERAITLIVHGEKIDLDEEFQRSRPSRPSKKSKARRR